VPSALRTGAGAFGSMPSRSVRSRANASEDVPTPAMPRSVGRTADEGEK